MNNKRNTLIYEYNNDNNNNNYITIFKGEKSLSPYEKKLLHQWKKELGFIGYISGYRYWNNETASVLIYCKEHPGIVDIENRRLNGLHRAKFYYI